MLLTRRALNALPPTWRELGLVILTATLVGMTIALSVPLLTLTLERAGYDPLAIGLNAAMGGLGIFLIGPFIDRIVRRLGPVTCFRLGLVVCSACLVLFMLHVGPWYWGAVRLVYGCAGAVMFVLSEAAVNSLTPDGQRGRVLGVYASLFTIGYAGGPLLLVLAGTEGSAPFLWAAALFLLGLLPTILLRRIEPRLRLEAGTRRYSLAAIGRAAPLPLVTVLVYAFFEGAAFALLPVWALDLGLSPDAAAALVGILLSGNILLQFPLGWLSDRLGRAQLVAGCGALAVVVLVLLPFLTGHMIALWILLVLLGGLTGGLYTLALSLLGDRFRGPDLTVANTAFVMTFQLGMIAGPPLVGAAMQLAGAGTFPLALVPPLVALTVMALVSRGGPQRSQTEDAVI
jgi:MFS family permease